MWCSFGLLVLVWSWSRTLPKKFQLKIMSQWLIWLDLWLLSDMSHCDYIGIIYMNMFSINLNIHTGLSGCCKYTVLNQTDIHDCFGLVGNVFFFCLLCLFLKVVIFFIWTRRLCFHYNHLYFHYLSTGFVE